jgi:hypothetical protein
MSASRLPARNSVPSRNFVRSSGADASPRVAIRFPERNPMDLPLADRSPAVPSGEAATREMLKYAETLGIPWKRIVLEEIDAERRLRMYFSDVEQGCPLKAILRVLSLAFLQSWRARDRIQRLACEARGASDRVAVKQLRMVLLEVAGESGPDKMTFAEHLWFAYQRILLLQRVRRAAARSRGSMAERLAFVCSRAHCGYDDAVWAIREEDSPRRSDRLDAAVRKTREEGFLIPRAETEARALAELRRIVRSSPHLNRQTATRRSRPERMPVSRARRVPLPADGI